MTDTLLISAYPGWSVGDARALTVRERNYFAALARWRADQERSANG